MAVVEPQSRAGRSMWRVGKGVFHWENFTNTYNTNPSLSTTKHLTKHKNLTRLQKNTWTHFVDAVPVGEDMI